MDTFEYVFPAIRGNQAEHEYYVSMCPVRLLPKIFSFDEEDVPAELRAQRTLNKQRVPEIARYIVDNPRSYIFSAITASIDAEKAAFEPYGDGGESRNIGRLRIPMDVRFVINDGQHRRAAFELALKENPEIGSQTIAVVFFLDEDLRRSQQMFADLNRYAARPDSSLNILYDHRDIKAVLAKAVVKEVRIFRTLTDTERSTLQARSGKLFTLSSIHNATFALLAHYKEAELSVQVEIAARFWNAVSEHIPDWESVQLKKATAGDMRQDYVHSHAIALAGLGRMGSLLLSLYPDDWSARLHPLTGIDWSRSNPDWEGRVMTGGRISKSRASVSLMSAYLKRQLQLPLTSEEENLERSVIKPQRKK